VPETAIIYKVLMTIFFYFTVNNVGTRSPFPGPPLPGLTPTSPIPKPYRNPSGCGPWSGAP